MADVKSGPGSEEVKKTPQNKNVREDDDFMDYIPSNTKGPIHEPEILSDAAEE